MVVLKSRIWSLCACFEGSGGCDYFPQQNWQALRVDIALDFALQGGLQFNYPLVDLVLFDGGNGVEHIFNALAGAAG